MSTLSVNLDILTLWIFLRARLRLLLGLSLAAAAAIVVFSSPKLSRVRPSLEAVYTSHASLLLPTNGRAGMLAIFGNTGRSDLDFWLSGAGALDRFLDQRNFYEKLKDRLHSQRPKLAGLSHSVRIEATQMESLKNGLEGVFSAAPKKDLGDEPGRVDRIVIQAEAGRPEDSEYLVLAAIPLLQNELLEVATRRARARRALIERYIRVGNANVAKAQKALRGTAQADPEVATQRQAQLSWLQGQCMRLRGEVADLTRQIESERSLTLASKESPEQSALAGLELEFRMAERIYLPGSLTLERIRERLQSLQRWARKMEAERRQKVDSFWRAALQSKRTALKEAEAELHQVQMGLPSSQAQIDFRKQERDLATWEEELLAWEKELVQTRIQECLCQGDGTAVVLQSPLPGTRSFAAADEFLAVYQKPIGMLPLAPLAGFVGILLIHLLQESRRIRTRAEYFIDAPVLGELPAVDRSYRRKWQALKSKGGW